VAVAPALTHSETAGSAHLRLIRRCSDGGMHEITTSTRDRGLRRLRRTTSIALAAAGALTAVFAGLAAKALPGHHSVTTQATVRTKAATAAKATAPALVPAQSAATPAAPAAAAPAQTQAPPVVVSGGT
jgi:hypothetical protein